MGLTILPGAAPHPNKVVTSKVSLINSDDYYTPHQTNQYNATWDANDFYHGPHLKGGTVAKM